MKSPEAVWDFWSHSPESLHQVTILMSDRGIPLSFRHMHGFGSHTFKWVNAAGEVFFVKYHFKTNQGIKNLESQLAEELLGKIPISILKICIMQLKIKNFLLGHYLCKLSRMQMR